MCVWAWLLQWCKSGVVGAVTVKLNVGGKKRRMSDIQEDRRCDLGFFVLPLPTLLKYHLTTCAWYGTSNPPSPGPWSRHPLIVNVLYTNNEREQLEQGLIGRTEVLPVFMAEKDRSVDSLDPSRLGCQLWKRIGRCCIRWFNETR